MAYKELTKQDPAPPVPKKPTKKPQPTPSLPQDSGLLAIFNRALAKIQAGEVELVVWNQEDVKQNGTEQFSQEEEALHWMLAKLYRDRNDKRIKNVLPYLRIPQGINFATKNFSLEEIIHFASPETEKTA